MRTAQWHAASARIATVFEALTSAGVATRQDT